MKHPRSRLAITLLLASGVASVEARAQETVGAGGHASHADSSDEIVVTAQKRAESLSSVPMAVSAFSGDALEERGLNNLLDLSIATPSLQLPIGGGVITPFLRGVGNSSNAVGNESSVAMYVDGVYYTRIPQGFFSLANVERVEVLKGPQGTLYGRNSSGGIIHIITTDPSQNTDVKAHVSYGNYNIFNGDLYANTGLGENLAANIAISGTKHGGFGRNITTGNRTNYIDGFTARSKLKWDASGAVSATLSGFYSYSKSSNQGNTYPGTTQGFLSPPFAQAQQIDFYDQQSDYDNLNWMKAYGGAFNLDVDAGFATFRSITAYMHQKEFVNVDIDYGPRPDSRARLYTDVDQFTQEFQLVSNPGRFSWLAGLYYYDTYSDYDPFRGEGLAFLPFDVLNDGIDNHVDITGKQWSKSYAAYAHATFEITDRLSLTGGLRYTIDKVRGAGKVDVTIGGQLAVPGTESSDKRRDEELSYKAVLDYKIAPETMVYASTNRGHKSGNFNIVPFVPGATKPEVIEAYEVGLKTALFDRRLRVNVAAFWYDIKNPQVQIFQAGAVALANAGSARVKGAEFDGALNVGSGFSINFGGTYLDAIYKSYTNAPSDVLIFQPPYGTVASSIDASGNRLPIAPKFTGALGAQYARDIAGGELLLNMDYSYNSGFFWQPDNQLRQKEYSLLNARALFKLEGGLSFAVWGKNITDKRYAAFAITQTGPAGAPYNAAPPATFGVTLGYEM